MNNSNFLKSMSGILFTILALITASLLPLPSGVERTGWYALAIFLSAIVMWICETLPMAVTALTMIFILMPVTGVMNLSAIYSSTLYSPDRHYGFHSLLDSSVQAIKFSSMYAPSGVRMDSGWNCTP